MQTRFLTPHFQFALLASLVISGERLAEAQQSVIHAAATEVALQQSAMNGWQLAASDNFVIHHRGEFGREEIERLARHLEARRRTIGSTWLGSDFVSKWSSACEVYLHRSDGQYEHHSRMPAETIGYARLKVGRGKVWSRRLDLRWHSEDERTLEVASHELTHIVLADRFCWRQIPRWADEGIAVGAEKGDRRDRLNQVLHEATESGRLFSVYELLSARGYPNDRGLADLFYAQSAALVSYLVEAHDYEVVLQLADAISEHGVEAGVRSLPAMRDARDLETRWRAWMQRPKQAESAIMVENAARK